MKTAIPTRMAHQDEEQAQSVNGQGEADPQDLAPSPYSDTAARRRRSSGSTPQPAAKIEKGRMGGPPTGRCRKVLLIDPSVSFHHPISDWRWNSAMSTRQLLSWLRNCPNTTCIHDSPFSNHEGHREHEEITSCSSW